MKQTSVKAFKEINEDGTLTKRQQEVMQIFHYNHPMPLTAKMISAKVCNGWKRLSELEDMGLIMVSGECIDINTHKTVSVYSLGKSAPKDKSTRPTYAQLEKELAKYPQKMSALYDMAFKKGVEAMFRQFFSGASDEFVNDQIPKIMEKINEH